MTIDEAITVESIYDHKTKWFYPRRLSWKDRVYVISKVAFYHNLREGRRVIHIFSVVCGKQLMKLKFDGDSLIWTLEEVFDNE